MPLSGTTDPGWYGKWKAMPLLCFTEPRRPGPRRRGLWDGEPAARPVLRRYDYGGKLFGRARIAYEASVCRPDDFNQSRPAAGRELHHAAVPGAYRLRIHPVDVRHRASAVQ